MKIKYLMLALLLNTTSHYAMNLEESPLEHSINFGFDNELDPEAMCTNVDIKIMNSNREIARLAHTMFSAEDIPQIEGILNKFSESSFTHERQQVAALKKIMVNLHSSKLRSGPLLTSSGPTTTRETENSQTAEFQKGILQLLLQNADHNRQKLEYQHEALKLEHQKAADENNRRRQELEAAVCSSTATIQNMTDNLAQTKKRDRYYLGYVAVLATIGIANIALTSAVIYLSNQAAD